MKALIISLFFCIPFISTSQQVISSGGQSATSSTLYGSATIGETIIGSASNGSTFGNQGFQQPLQTDITAVFDQNNQHVNVIIFPNPIKSKFSIRFDKQLTQPLLAKITSINGQVIKQFQIDQKNSLVEVQLDEAMEGLFILTLSDINGSSIHHFKILKIKG